MPWMLDQEWAWRVLSPLLDDDSARMLTLCALETRHRALWRFLIYHDAPRRPVCVTLLLHHAVAHSCWQATAAIQRELLAHSKHHRPRLARDVSLSTVRRLADDHGLTVSAAMVSVIRRYDLSPVPLPPHIMYEACRLGNLDAVMWLHVATPYYPHRALEIAAKSRQFVVLEWLLQHLDTARPMKRPVRIRRTLMGEDAQALGGIYTWTVRLFDKFGTRFACGASREYGLLPRRQVEKLDSKYPLENWAAEQGHADLLDALVQLPSFSNIVVSMAALRLAAERGHAAVVQWVCRRTKPSQSDRATLFTGALFNGQLGVAMWLHRKYGRKLECTAYIRESALARGHKETVRWIDKVYPEVKTTPQMHSVTPGAWNDPLVVAAAKGQLETVRELCETREVSTRAIECAAREGLLDVVQWLDSQLLRQSGPYDPSRLSTALLLAASNGKVDVVRWLVEERGAWNRQLLTSAVDSNDVAMVAFVFSHARAHAVRNGVHVGDIVDDDVKPGQLITRGKHDALVWLLNNVPSGLVNARDLPCLRFLDTIERYRDEEEATMRTQTDVLNVCRPYEWELVSGQAREKILEASRALLLSLPASMSLTLTWLPAWAIRTSSYEVLVALVEIQHSEVFTSSSLTLLLKSTRDPRKVQWFLEHERAKPVLVEHWVRTIRWAAQFAHADLVQWLLSRNEDLPTLRTAVWTGAKHGHVSVLQCVAQYLALHSLTRYSVFCSRVWRSTASAAAENGHLDAIQWLRKSGLCSLQADSPLIADTAARYGHVHILQWLHSMTGGQVSCSARGVHCALGNQHSSAVQWLQKQKKEHSSLS